LLFAEKHYFYLLQTVFMRSYGQSPRSMPPLTPFCYASFECIINICLTSYFFFLTKDKHKVSNNTRQLFKHKYLHATFGITKEEEIELWSFCIKVRCLTAEL